MTAYSEDVTSVELIASWQMPAGTRVHAYRAPDGEVVEICARSTAQAAIDVLNFRREQRAARRSRGERVFVQTGPSRQYLNTQREEDAE